MVCVWFIFPLKGNMIMMRTAEYTDLLAMWARPDAAPMPPAEELPAGSARESASDADEA